MNWGTAAMKAARLAWLGYRLYRADPEAAKAVAARAVAEVKKRKKAR